MSDFTKEQENSKKKLGELLLPAMEKIDALMLSPEERANLVLEFLKAGMDKETKDFFSPPLLWDMICFCSSILGAYSIRTPEVPKQFHEAVKTICTMIFQVHYFGTAKDNMPEEQRDEEYEIWTDRIAGAKNIHSRSKKYTQGEN